MDLNRITIIGNMTRDPELRTTPNGKSVASFSVATNRYWTDQNGQKQKETEYHNVVLWTKLAEVAAQYLHKGNKIYIEGRLRTREWTAQDGTKRTRVEIIGENMIMLGSRPAAGSAGSFPSTTGHGSSAEEPQEVIEEVIKVEDIPF